MQIVTYVLLAFAVVAAIDLIFGDKLGLGSQLHQGIMMLGPLTLAMAGVMVLSPYIAELLSGVSGSFPEFLDFSIIPASIFANDSGGAQLAVDLARDPEIGLFNGLVVASMMGVTITFTIPYSLQVTKPENHDSLLLGIICGMVTIPVGCIIGGLMLGIGFLPLVLDLVPMILLLAAVAVGIVRFRRVTLRIFAIFGWIIRLLITVGLIIGIVEFLTEWRILPVSMPLTDVMNTILNIACVMAGAFPLLHIVKLIFKKPFALLGKRLGINDTAALGLLSTVATSLTTFGMVNEMDKRGITVNAAFAVSAAFVFVDHLAFTMSYNSAYLPSMIVAKLLSGVAAVAMACLLMRLDSKKVAANRNS